MNIVLAAINAKYIHSSLAIKSLKAFAKGYDIKLAEYTINNNKDAIIAGIYELKPDILGFSCYIWNIGILSELIPIFRKIMPSTIIIAGGPEASYDPDFLIEKGVNVVVAGEGEEAFVKLISKYPNISDGVYCSDSIVLDSIPFVYEKDLENLKNRIIYYESSRGCPNNCSYCLSSATKGLRFLSIDRVKNDLNFFLEASVTQVKFVDRTFNSNRNHAIEIWSYLIENNNGITNFHFEISADLLSEQELELLKTAPPGLFQFEIGVQTTNEKALKLINRHTNLRRLFENVKKINDGANIHQHLDLIAGLPGEDYNSFKESFNTVYFLKPQQLQLGFLKMLKGSGIRNSEGIVYKDSAPYEVLYTKDLSFDELLKLKGVESMLDMYYNSGQFSNTLWYLIKDFESPFDFYFKLYNFYKDNGYDLVSHNKIKLYSILYKFSCSDVVKELLRFDLFLNENFKNLPDWLNVGLLENEKTGIRRFYNDRCNVDRFLPHLRDYEPKQLARICHIEPFDYNILSSEPEKKRIYILFDYSSNTISLDKAIHASYRPILI